MHNAGSLHSSDISTVVQVFVAGATGNTGKRVVQQLSAKGIKVLAGTRVCSLPHLQKHQIPAKQMLQHQYRTFPSIKLSCLALMLLVQTDHCDYLSQH